MLQGMLLGLYGAVFRIRNALNTESVIRPTVLAKAAAQANDPQLKAKYKKSS